MKISPLKTNNRSYIVGVIGFSIALAIFLAVLFTTRSFIHSPTSREYNIGLSMLFTFLVSTSISIFCYPYFSFVVSRYAWHIDPLKRGTGMLLGAIIPPALIISFWVFTFNWGFGSSKTSGDPTSTVDYFDHIIIAIIITLFMTMAYELRAIYARWKTGVIAEEKLKREAIEYQYNALTTQLDPHFLFNSLNLLASLVREKNDKALHFIDNFSDVYRYVLNAQKEVVVSVKEELALVDKYLNLQKIRFEENLHYSIEIDYTYNELLLPPLSIQLLIENAIKHNIISTSKPLKITIKGCDNMLCVSNNYQPRKDTESSKIGQKILIQRFAHLSDVAPEFTIKDNQYIAKIPLIHE